MNNFERAVKTTEEIRDALSVEVARARDERVLIRNMDVDGLFLRASRRADFNQRTADLQLALGNDLKAVAEELGISEVTTEGLKAHAPIFAQRFSGLLAEVRALASALSELDSLNRLLGQRALSYVRAHLAVLRPQPAAYDRRGTSATDSRASTVVRVV